MMEQRRRFKVCDYEHYLNTQAMGHIIAFDLMTRDVPCHALTMRS